MTLANGSGNLSIIILLINHWKTADDVPAQTDISDLSRALNRMDSLLLGRPFVTHLASSRMVQDHTLDCFLS